MENLKYIKGVRTFSVTYSKGGDVGSWFTLAEVNLHWKQLEENFEVIYINTTERDNFQYLTLTFILKSQEGKNDFW